MYTMGGKDALAKTLAIVRDAWGYQRPSVHALPLKAVFHMVTRHGHEMDRDYFVAQLKTVNPIDLRSRAIVKRIEMQNRSLPEALYGAMLDLYNHERPRQGRLVAPAGPNRPWAHIGLNPDPLTPEQIVAVQVAYQHGASVSQLVERFRTSRAQIETAIRPVVYGDVHSEPADTAHPRTYIHVNA
jgi:hypothetical protein